jgi:hypothetical protein
VLGIWCLTTLLFVVSSVFAQEGDIDFALDVSSATVPLPKIFRPNIDLSGRGFHQEPSWPQGLAAGEVLDSWQKDVGLENVYRMQYNLWEISELAKDKDAQDKLLSNYESVIKKITEAGGIVILDIFSTPAGLGKVLDRKSVPFNLAAFKELIKSHIRNLSCIKRYNVWYEVWSAPDLDDFFLGRKQEYLNLYKAVAEGIKELEEETKTYIPVGGPGVSWWFRNLEGNTSITPERSLIYDLIKFCSRYKLPLDFITWHAYSTDPKTETETTVYKKSSVGLIRAWLTYFNLDSNIPLIVDEWNYDRENNVLFERGEKSNVCASFIPARLKNMYEAGIDYQLYFSLEDFQNNKEGVVRNVGIFWFVQKTAGYEGGAKSIYNVFRMLDNLGPDMFISPKIHDDFVTAIATRSGDDIVVLISNYIDPGIATNYLSRNIAGLKDSERKVLLNLIKSGRIEKIINRQLDIATLRGASAKLKGLLKKSQELNEQAEKLISVNRKINIAIKNLIPSISSTDQQGKDIPSVAKEVYLYQRYLIDSTCSVSCNFIPVEEKEISASEPYQETLVLSPYSVNMIVLKKGPKVIEAVTPANEQSIPGEEPKKSVESEKPKEAKELIAPSK